MQSCWWCIHEYFSESRNTIVWRVHLLRARERYLHCPCGDQRIRVLARRKHSTTVYAVEGDESMKQFLSRNKYSLMSSFFFLFGMITGRILPQWTNMRAVNYDLFYWSFVAVALSIMVFTVFRWEQ